LVLLLVLALGAHTPLFALLYHALPGFNLFRGTAKFDFFAVLFAIALSARGAQWLLECERPLHGSAAVAAGFAALLLGAIFVFAAPGSPLAAALFRAGLLLGLAAMLLWLRGRGLRIAATLLLLLGVVDTISAAWPYRASFPVASLTQSPAVRFMRRHRSEGRVLDLAVPNGAMLAGAQQIWGYDPGVLKRWAQFCYASQGAPLEDASQYLRFAKVPPSLALADLRWVIQHVADGIRTRAVADTLPAAFPVAGVAVETNPAKCLARLNAASFDPRRLALVERRPPFVPKSAAGSARLRWIDSDHMMLRVHTPGPAFVVVSAAYARGWRAVDGRSGANYPVMAADHAFIGLPLPAGSHDVLLSYRPPLWWPALFISVAALGLLGLVLRRAPVGEGFLPGRCGTGVSSDF